MSKWQSRLQCKEREIWTPLGLKDSNLRMAGSKPAAVPLGETPFNQIKIQKLSHPNELNWVPSVYHGRGYWLILP